VLERENRELKERLAELYLEWIPKNSGTGSATFMIGPLGNRVKLFAVITAAVRFLCRRLLPTKPGYGRYYLLPNLEWFSSSDFHRTQRLHLTQLLESEITCRQSFNFDQTTVRRINVRWIICNVPGLFYVPSAHFVFMKRAEPVAKSLFLI
jgi:hypothetical protein